TGKVIENFPALVDAEDLVRVGDTARALGSREHTDRRGAVIVMDLGVDDVDGKYDPTLPDGLDQAVVVEHELACALGLADRMGRVDSVYQERAGDALGG